MNRRSFFKSIGAIVGGIALEQAVPLGRVYSFPKEIVIAKPLGNYFLTTEWVSAKTLRILHEQLNSFDDLGWKRHPSGIILTQ